MKNSTDVYLKCVESHPTLTIGKFYKLIDRKDNSVRVRDDLGQLLYVNRGAFYGYYSKTKDKGRTK